jgi:hypothetical protein
MNFAISHEKTTGRQADPPPSANFEQLAVVNFQPWWYRQN